MYSGYNGAKPPTSLSMGNYNKLNGSNPYHTSFSVNPHRMIPLKTLPPKPLPPKPMRPHLQNTRNDARNNKIKSTADTPLTPHSRSMTAGFVQKSTFNTASIQQAADLPYKRMPQTQQQHSAPLPYNKQHSAPQQRYDPQPPQALAHTLPQKAQHRTMQQRVWDNYKHIQTQHDHMETHNQASITPSNSTTQTGPVPVAAVTHNAPKLRAHNSHNASTQNMRQCPLQYMGCNACYNKYEVNVHYSEYQKEHLDFVIAYFENKIQNMAHDYTRKIKEINITNVNKIEELKHVNAKQMHGLQEENEQLKCELDDLQERVNDFALQRKHTSSSEQRKITVHSRIPGRKMKATESKIPATFREFQKVRGFTEEIVSSGDSDVDIDAEYSK